jgi:hypothetical protein
MSGLPVGSIVASILSVTDFFHQVTPGETWQQADGAAVASSTALGKIILGGGTDYGELRTANNTEALSPNLNGVFLRGRDYGQPGNLRNPEGSLKPGHLQMDDVGPHTHNTQVGYQNVYSPGAGAPVWQGTAGAESSNPNVVAGNPRAETRPKNVTVNFFIRVN